MSTPLSNLALQVGLLGSLAATAAARAPMLPRDHAVCPKGQQVLEVQPVVVVNPIQRIAASTETWTRTVPATASDPTDGPGFDAVTTATSTGTHTEPTTFTLTGPGLLPNTVIVVVPSQSVPSTSVPTSQTTTPASSPAAPSSTTTTSTTMTSSTTTTTTTSTTTTAGPPVIDPPIVDPPVVDPPARACAPPLTLAIGDCPIQGSSLFRYENQLNFITGYGVLSGTGGVGPDYYIDQALSLSSTGRAPGIRMPAISPEGFPTGPGPLPGGPTYYPGLTTTFGGMAPYDANGFTLIYTGYLIATETGAHEFCTEADNRAEWYVGPDDAFPCGRSGLQAVSGRTPLVRSWFGPASPVQGRQCATIELTAGFWYPYRIVYGNFGSPSSLESSVTPPSGAVNNIIQDTPQLVPPSCYS